ncbi:MAG: DUF4003 domain-containing protein [Lachnospiraceae bacterium]|nr:DUF4003 domain-containing protein [Lachnospiraceae bacterium]
MADIYERITENRKVIKKAAFAESEIARSASAMLMACADKDADLDRLKMCYKILKKNKGIFSDFRGYSQLIIMSKMAMQPDPEEYLNNASRVYGIIRKGKFFTSEIMALAALCIVDYGRMDSAEQIAEKTRDIQKAMNSKHPFLVDNDNTAFSALLALTDKSTAQIVDEVEECYEIIKDRFPLHKGAEYALCQVLSIYVGNAKTRCDRALKLFEGFKKSGVRYGKEHELAFLAVLADLEAPDNEIIKDVIAACNKLKRTKGFGPLVMDKQTRLMFGSMITVHDMASDKYGTASTVSSAISMAIIYEIVVLMVILMTTSTTATASSASASS